MNQLKKQLLCLTALVSATHLFGAANTTTNIVPRSQSFDAARQMVGWNNTEWGINRKSADDRYNMSFNLTFGYTQTFRGNRLAQCLFGDDLVCGDCDDSSAIKISGLAVTDRAATDWLGDYFGLPLTYKGTVSFKPKISNFILDFSFYTGLDAWVDGLYFRVHSPFVRTKWNLNATESSSIEQNVYSELLDYSEIAYPVGYFSAENVAKGNTTASFLAYANGCTPSINNEVYACPSDRGFTEVINGRAPAGCTDLNPVIWQPLCCSRIINSCDCDDNGAQIRNGFGEIRFVLGRNFFSDDPERDCHIGIGAYAAAPTGTRVGESRYLFAPIVGNGKHWELGGQVTAHHIFWRSEDDNKSFGIYLEANATHLFGACQTRCFDLCSAGSNSRYMLAEKLGPNQLSNPRLGFQTDNVFLEFATEYAPVANITRRDVTSTIAAQGDLAISFAYQASGFQWDLGYNFWGRSCEQLRLSTDCCPVIQEPWALKGTAFVYGFEQGTKNPVALAATDSHATIHGGSNKAPTSLANILTLNAFIDNNVVAVDNSGNQVASPITKNPPIWTSNRPVLIDESDFDFTGTRGISHKLFTHLNYALPEFKDSQWSPYMGVGAEVEFGSASEGCRAKCETDCYTSCNTSCNTSCSTSCNTSCEPACTSTPCPTIKECCTSCALTQWGVWFKVGASYN